MALKYKIKVETEWKPDPNQTEIKTKPEPKPKREVREVVACETLVAAVGTVQDVLIYQYDKDAIIFVYAKIEGSDREFYRQSAQGIRRTEKEELQLRLSR